MSKELLLLLLIVTCLLLVIIHLWNEKHMLENKIKHMELMNEKTYGIPWNPNEKHFIKRIGSIYANGDLDTQELEINFVVDSDYEKFVNKCSNIHIINENIALRKSNNSKDINPIENNSN